MKFAAPVVRVSDPELRGGAGVFETTTVAQIGRMKFGGLSEIARRTMLRDFRNIDPAEARGLLLEGSSRVVPSSDERLSMSALRQLEDLGVEVRTETMAR